MVFTPVMRCDGFGFHRRRDFILLYHCIFCGDDNNYGCNGANGHWANARARAKEHGHIHPNQWHHSHVCNNNNNDSVAAHRARWQQRKMVADRRKIVMIATIIVEKQISNHNQMASHPWMIEREKEIKTCDECADDSLWLFRYVQQLFSKLMIAFCVADGIMNFFETQVVS